MSKQRSIRQKILVYTFLAFTILGLALLSSQSALANMRVDSGGQVPFYARLERGEPFHTDDWAVIVFYRPPGCIPAGFNLLDFFDIPAVFGCQPATTDGFEIWKNGPPPIDDTPIHTEAHGRGAVPVWFVSWTELQVAMQDDVVTIAELGSMDSLLEGTATFFHETLLPTGGANNSIINYVAKGSLDGGGSFWVHASSNSASGKMNTQIRINK